MECDSERITLVVSDDGAGFDVRSDFPGHLGLRSMRERSSRLGGTLARRDARSRRRRRQQCWGRVVAGSRQYGCTVDVGPQRGVDGEV
jgi:glucose-6-phosphate-specific signal transduction histidine kinase